MGTSLEVEQTDVAEQLCECCSGPRTVVTGFVHYRNGQTIAAYIASLYPGGTKHDKEARIDGILGTWGTDDETDHVTFGANCKVGRGCMLVGPAEVDLEEDEKAIYGQRLTREEGLGHPWVGDFWGVLDAILTQDPVVAHFYYGEVTGDDPE